MLLMRWFLDSRKIDGYSIANESTVEFKKKSENRQRKYSYMDHHVREEAKLCDDKKACKRTGYLPACCRAPRTSRAAPPLALPSQRHRQCEAKLPHYLCLHSGGARRPYSARCLQTRRGDKVPHKAYSAQVLSIARNLPVFLDRPINREFSALANTREKK